MTHLWTGIAALLIAVSWLAALAAALLTEYAGWHAVITDHHIVGGLAVAFLVAPVVFMTVQTILGLLATPFGLLAERGD